MRILLVEDNSDHRELMRLALTGHDATWQVEGVVSGEEALRHLAEGEAYDLVFLDYSLPGRDGLEVLEEIRRGEAPPPVVMVTGRGDEQVAVWAMKGGAYDYVVKGGGYLQRLPVVAQRALEAQQLAVERKRAEEALRESEERHRAVVEQSPDGIYLIDTETKRILEANTSFQRMLGYSSEEIIGLSIYDFVVANKKDIDQRFQNVLEGKGPFNFERQLRRKDGSLIDIWVSTNLISFRGRKVICTLARDLTERKHIEDRLRKSREQLRAFSARLQAIREEERTLIAREIHDVLGQALTGLRMDLSWLAKKLPEDQKPMIEKTASMSNLVDTTIQAVRKISAELRPGVLDDLGLMAAIEWQAQDFQARSGIKCELNSSLEGFDLEHLERELSTAAFRILQEASANVARHAKATRVRISLKRDAGNLMLMVRDNGRGISKREISDPTSLGLLGMRERAYLLGGKVEVSGRPGKGTTVTVSIPLKQSEKRR